MGKIGKTNRVLILGLVTLWGCGNPNFTESESAGEYYQICPTAFNIVRATQTYGDGAPSLQLFDRQGKLLQTEAINPLSRLLVTSVKGDSIVISYVVSPSDMEHFLPAFKNDKFNPATLGKYKLKYDYRTENQYTEHHQDMIDSLSFNKKSNEMIVFLKGKQLISIPICQIVAGETSITSYDERLHIVSDYSFTKPLRSDYLKKVVDSYKD